MAIDGGTPDTLAPTASYHLQLISSAALRVHRSTAEEIERLPFEAFAEFPVVVFKLLDAVKQ